MARPRKDPAEEREQRINLRLTATERMRVEANAAFFGLSASEYTRRRALDIRMPAAHADRKQQAAVATALIRLGNNLNQIARHMNAGRDAPPDLATLIARIDAELDRLYDPEAGETGPVVPGSGPLLSP